MRAQSASLVSAVRCIEPSIGRKRLLLECPIPCSGDADGPVTAVNVYGMVRRAWTTAISAGPLRSTGQTYQRYSPFVRVSVRPACRHRLVNS